MCLHLKSKLKREKLSFFAMLLMLKCKIWQEIDQSEATFYSIWNLKLVAHM